MKITVEINVSARAALLLERLLAVLAPVMHIPPLSQAQKNELQAVFAQPGSVTVLAGETFADQSTDKAAEQPRADRSATPGGRPQWKRTPAPPIVPDPEATRPAAVAEPSSDAEGTATRRPSWITPERDKVILRDYPRGVDLDTMYAALSLLPGPAFNRQRIGIRAYALGVSRQATSTAPSAPVAPTQAGEQPAPRPPPTGAHEADYETIHGWAAQRGLAPARERMDLDAVNRKRTELGLPPFVVKARNRADGGGSLDA